MRTIMQHGNCCAQQLDSWLPNLVPDLCLQQVFLLQKLSTIQLLKLHLQQALLSHGTSTQHNQEGQLKAAAKLSQHSRA